MNNHEKPTILHQMSGTLSLIFDGQEDWRDGKKSGVKHSVSINLYRIQFSGVLQIDIFL